jgi:hypothetical protein
MAKPLLSKLPAPDVGADVRAEPIIDIKYIDIRYLACEYGEIRPPYRIFGSALSSSAAHATLPPGRPPSRHGPQFARRKLAVLTEMAKPLLARLPAVIDVTPVGADAGAEANTEGKYL